MNTAVTKKSIVALVVAVLVGTSFSFATPQRAEAFPWGGQFTQVIHCFNSVTWTNVSAPRGGNYIWVPGATRTYDYSPPTHAGQWGLGLAAPPYFCIVSPLPLIIFPGIIMSMLGASA